LAFNAAVSKVTKVLQTYPLNFVRLPSEHQKKITVKKKTLFNWSSGKNSALAFYKSLQIPNLKLNAY
jgi:hypothetical protein